MSKIRKINVSEVSGNISSYFQPGTVWLDRNNGLRISDGVTEGGLNLLAIPVTYVELVSKINGSELVPGTSYLITDFRTCYDQPDYDKYRGRITTGNYREGNIHPIIVTAISENKLSPDAYQPDYSKDKIKYDHTYNSTFITSGQAYGRITERIDEWGNRTDYDHREVLFKRYRFYYAEPVPKSGTISMDALGNVTGTNTQFDTDFSVNDYLAIPDTSDYMFQITQIDSPTSMVVTGNTIPETSNRAYHRGYKSTYGTYAGGYVSPYQNNIDSTEDFEEFRTFLLGNEPVDNTVMGNFHNLLVNYDEFDFDLPNNVFLSRSVNNAFGNGCYNNTFADPVLNCEIGNYFYNNIYSEADEDFRRNVITGPFYSNTMLGEFSHNRISSEFSYNYVGSDFTYNQIGNYFFGNVLGESFNNCVIGNGFNLNRVYYSFQKNRVAEECYENSFYYSVEFNVIGSNFNNNTIGTYNDRGSHNFQKNKIGEYCKSNLFGGAVEGNNIGNGFTANEIGPDFSYNSIGEYCLLNTVGEDFNQNRIGNDFVFNEIGNYFFSNKIGNTFSSNTISNNFSYNQIGDYFESNTVLNDFGYGGGQAYGNQIGNYFRDNTIGEYFYNNNIRDLFSYNLIGDYFRNNDVLVQNLSEEDFNQNVGKITSVTYTSNGGAVGVYTAVTGTTAGSGVNSTFDVTLEATNPVVSGGGINHILNSKLGQFWNDYGGNYLQGGYLLDEMTPLAGWYIVDDLGTIRQILSDPVWFSGGNPTPIDNGGGWFMVLDGPWTISNSSPTITLYEELPTVTFEAVVTSVTLNNAGKGYAVNDTIQIPGSQIGGDTGVNDIEITVTGITPSPAVYGNYSCTIFKNSSGINRLSYYDDNDVLTITDFTG